MVSNTMTNTAMLNEFIKAAQTEVVIPVYSVYIHEAPNGKRYVGITSQRLADRWGHGAPYKKNKHLYSAIVKYGWDAFSHIVVATNLLYQDACEIERRLIAALKTNQREYGYNKSIGGESSSIGCKKTDEQKAVLSAISKRIWEDEDFRKRVTEAVKRKGIRPPSRRGSISEKRKQVFKYDINGNFIESYFSIAEAARRNGVTVMAISNACNGKTKTSCGCLFSFQGGDVNASKVS